MENPRPAKVAVVEEVRERLASSAASVVTEYRGLTVAQLAELRRALAAVGDYKIYKNTLVRLAVAGSEYQELTDLLSGPTAIAFVNGEISAAAKALRDFARSNPALILKGGLAGGSPLSTDDLTRLADLPSRDVLLARFAGGLAAPLQQLAGLLQALPRNLAYGLSALLDQRGGPPAQAQTPPGEAETPPGEADTPPAEAETPVAEPEAAAAQPEAAAAQPEPEAEVATAGGDPEPESGEPSAAEADPEPEGAEAPAASQSGE